MSNNLIDWELVNNAKSKMIVKMEVKIMTIIRVNNKREQESNIIKRDD